jgi:hypothetical protein
MKEFGREPVQVRMQSTLFEPFPQSSLRPIDSAVPSDDDNIVGSYVPVSHRHNTCFLVVQTRDSVQQLYHHSLWRDRCFLVFLR